MTAAAGAAEKWGAAGSDRTCRVFKAAAFLLQYLANAIVSLAYQKNTCYYYIEFYAQPFIMGSGEVAIVSVTYKKLWILLIEKHITKAQLRKSANLSPATLTKLNKDEYVSMEILTRICRVLDCDIGDIVEVEK